MTLLAPTGERMAFYEAARHYDQEALRVIASVMMDDKQPASLRLAAANDLLDRAYGKPPQAVVSAPPIVSRPIRGSHPNVGTVRDTMKKPRYVSGGGAEVTSQCASSRPPRGRAIKLPPSEPPAES